MLEHFLNGWVDYPKGYKSVNIHIELGHQNKKSTAAGTTIDFLLTNINSEAGQALDH